MRNGLIVLAVVLFVTAVVFGAPYLDRPLPAWAQNFGFGAGWDYSDSGRGGTVCVKRPQSPPAVSKEPPLAPASVRPTSSDETK